MQPDRKPRHADFADRPVERGTSRGDTQIVSDTGRDRTDQHLARRRTE
jgi:hypothetical protein